MVLHEAEPTRRLERPVGMRRQCRGSLASRSIRADLRPTQERTYESILTWVISKSFLQACSYLMRRHVVRTSTLIERPVGTRRQRRGLLASRSIRADIRPTHGRAYARIRMHGILTRAIGKSLVQTCICLMRR